MHVSENSSIKHFLTFLHLPVTHSPATDQVCSLVGLIVQILRQFTTLHISDLVLSTICLFYSPRLVNRYHILVGTY